MRIIQHDKQYHRKLLLSSFHLNGHISGFYPPTEKLKTTLYGIILNLLNGDRFVQQNEQDQRKISKAINAN